MQRKRRRRCTGADGCTNQESNPAQAAQNYRAVSRVYQHFFYAQMARQRLQALGEPLYVSESQVETFKAPQIPHLSDTFPADSPHIAKARLVANAGLNDYIGQELEADPDSDSWGALAEAQLYASFGESYRAMRALKRALPYAASAPIKSIPLAYWRILFPEAWWETIKSESAKNGLDPYLVASLIRQESEFNPSVISYANAYGLMQLLPSVGKSLARQEGMSHFQTYQLLDPETNIRLGTRYLRQMIDRFGGVQEYALAAYNAGEERVTDWQAAGPYHGIDEFVESIPFTQTREYVQGILRNEEIYRGSTSLRNSVPQGDRYPIAQLPSSNLIEGCGNRQHCATGASKVRLEFAAVSVATVGIEAHARASQLPEGRMSADLQFLEEWIPERMDPGTVFLLQNETKLGHAQNPYVAVMSCPRCGTMGLITRRQLTGGEG